MHEEYPLSGLEVGGEGVVSALRNPGSMNRRLRDLGLIEGTRIRCILKSPWGDPSAYLFRGAVVALRREDSSLIFLQG